MKNKGFTLIELLAVIVILAIIALIAVPIVLNIIDNSKEQSRKRSIESYAVAVKDAFAVYSLTHQYEDMVGSYTQSNNGHTLTKTDLEDPIKVDYSNSIVKCVDIILYADGELYLGRCTVGSNTKEYSHGTLQQTGYTGPVYRIDSQNIAVGDTVSLEPKTVWCSKSQYYNSCDNYIYYSTKEECDETERTCEQETISPLKTTTSDISSSVYLKHDVVNDVVVASYVCKYEYCIKGADPSKYGTYTGMSTTIVTDVSGLNPTGNIAVINSLMNNSCIEDEECESSFSNTSSGVVNYAPWSISAYANGKVISNDYYAGYTCQVEVNGDSSCTYSEP